MPTSLREQAQELLALSERVDASFGQAVQLMLDCKARVIISGMGKSVLIGGKIAATLASTGTRSFFMHPGEPFHGDPGMVRFDDLADIVVLGASVRSEVFPNNLTPTTSTAVALAIGDALAVALIRRRDFPPLDFKQTADVIALTA